MGYHLTLTETLLQQMDAQAPAVGPTSWEVGRLVLAPEHRSDVEALRRCLALAITYACEQTHIAHLYASCTHVLSRLYRRFAFAVFARDVPLPGSQKVYTLIRGTGADVAAALRGTPPARQAQ